MANMMQTWEYWSLFAIGKCEMKPDSEKKEKADLLECGDYKTGKGVWDMEKEFSMPCGGKLSLKYVVLKPMETYRDWSPEDVGRPSESNPVKMRGGK